LRDGFGYVRVVEIVNRFQARVAFNAVFDLIVKARRDLVDCFEADVAFELHQQFGVAVTAFGDGDLFRRRRVFLLGDGLDEHAVPPLFAPASELTGEGGDENENDCQREVYQEVIAVHCGTSSKLDPVVLTLELIKPHLVLVGAVFVILAVCAEADAPAGRDHLAAHLAVFRGAERHVRKVVVFHRLLFDGARVDL
jgi:hypothetical protein